MLTNKTDSDPHMSDIMVLWELTRLGISFDEAEKIVNNKVQRKLFVDRIRAKENANLLYIFNKAITHEDDSY